jgi:hypothetical protein
MRHPIRLKRKVHAAIGTAVRGAAAGARGPASTSGTRFSVVLLLGRAPSATRGREKKCGEANDAIHGVTVIIPPKARMRLAPVGEPIPDALEKPVHGV